MELAGQIQTVPLASASSNNYAEGLKLVNLAELRPVGVVRRRPIIVFINIMFSLGQSMRLDQPAQASQPLSHRLNYFRPAP